MQNDSKKDYGVLIAQKAERLITGLYLVTDLIDNEEPIKGALRTNALVLLASMNTLAQPEVKDRIKEYKVSLKSVTEVLSLLHVGTTAGIISEMNGRLLGEGFRALQLVLEKKQPLLTEAMLTVEGEDSLASVPVFTEAITGTSYDVITPRSLRMNQSDLGAAKERVVNAQEVPHEELKETTVTNKGQNSPASSSEVSSIPAYRATPRPVSSFQNRKKGRKEQILALFVRGVDVSIKDISARIKGCSEKTIQRELNNLVFEGLIERIGEKRWSRYIVR